MFVIVAYDVNKKRVAKALKVCRKYLWTVQNSVFEGHLTHAELQRLKEELRKVIITEEDGVVIYCLESVRFTHKETIGKRLRQGAIIE